MGCDIHMHVEAKVDGQWQHLGESIRIHRNYDLFGRLAGVRRGVAPIVPQRGVPSDANALTKIMAKDVDWHSHSWLSFDEMMTVVKEFGVDAFSVDHLPFSLWLCGNYITDYNRIAGLFNGIEDVRFVFWFDN